MTIETVSENRSHGGAQGVYSHASSETGCGGTAIEDPPGVREGNGMKLYLAYLRDPDGNKLCALHRLDA